jgi:L-alanine-DL-glutamate epimerase-like enolase superfamily enzyme
LDANGAFSAMDALNNLEKLAEFQIHSVEQPIEVGQHQELRQLIQQSPIPIALDEELIGVENRRELLDALMPPYLILKPMLLGGLAACETWIEAAHEKGILWWSTSMLESNIGLEFIAQWVATKNNELPQGLGTGALYENNFAGSLEIRKSEMWRKNEN